MVRGMGDAADHDPGAPARDIEKRDLEFPEFVVPVPQELQTVSGSLPVAFDESTAVLDVGEWRRGDIDSEEVLEPICFAHALVNHLFQHATSAGVGSVGAAREVLLAGVATDGGHLEAL